MPRRWKLLRRPEPRIEIWLSSGAEARPDEHARREVEHVLEVGRARLADPRLVHEIDRPGCPLQLLSGLLLGFRPLVRDAGALDDDRFQRGDGLPGGWLREGRTSHEEQHDETRGRASASP